MFDLVLDIVQILRRGYLSEDDPWANPFLYELAFWVALIPVVLLFWRWRPAWLSRLEDLLVAFSRRRAMSVLAIFLLSLGLRVALLPVQPVPVPDVHDEFSYLMQAQTFNLGRLTNPPHPMWRHFETFHVNVKPTYQAMYPPGQAAFLALGLRLTGEPWVGVLLSVALMCAATTWMLQGWMPPQWALLGGLFCVLRFAVAGKMIDSYYGGAVAALGGALVLGALPRLRRKVDPIGCALLFAVGLVLMAYTRQYEGFVLSLIPLGWLAFWLVRQWRESPGLVLRVVACGLLVLLPAGGFLLYYNYRGTGDMFTMPYMINQETYHITKPFLWQERYPTPDYRHFEMKKFYLFHELPDYLQARQPGGVQKILEEKGRVYYQSFLWPLLLAAVPTALVAWKSRKLRMLVAVGLLVLVALGLVIWPPEAQYPAPAMAIVIAIMVLSVRLARTIRISAFGLGLSRAIVAGVAAVLLSFVGYSVANPAKLGYMTYRIPGYMDRARIQTTLEAMPGKHLVIVRRQYFGWPGFEWVYNDADIDASRVVWARHMGDELNHELVQYFRDRQVWMMDADARILNAYQKDVPVVSGIEQRVEARPNDPSPLAKKAHAE